MSRQRRIKTVHSLAIWTEFVKWMHFTFEQERHISFGRIGNYGYKIEEKSGKKIPFLFMADSFLKQHHLTNKFPSFVLKPTVKINIAVISKHLEIATE